MVSDTRGMTYLEEGPRIVIPSVTGLWCDACDEVVMYGEEAERVSQAMLAITNHPRTDA